MEASASRQLFYATINGAVLRLRLLCCELRPLWCSYCRRRGDHLLNEVELDLRR